MRLLIKGANLRLCGGGKGDILIEDGKIAALGGEILADAETIQAHGLLAAPGLVDMHVHLRDPGFTQKEDIVTGCLAAASGGVTSLLAMPNTNPVVDNVKTIFYILDRAEHADARVYVSAAITKGQNGQVLTDFNELKCAGASAVTDDGRPVEHAYMQKNAMERAMENGLLPISHAEDLSLVNGGILNEGAVSKALGVKGIHRASEDISTMREVMLSEYYGLPIHIAHVSTKGSVELIRQAKARGVMVTCETAPHYFALTDRMLMTRDADYRMNPPLREEADRLAILAGIQDGTIDAIATDHAPHTPEEKADFERAPNGVVGLETSLAAGITYLVNENVITIERLIELMSTNPAKLLGIPAGTLAERENADLILIDPDKSWTVTPEGFCSKARNSAFKNTTLTGRVMLTICRGKVVMSRL